jgi:hypothetical protein
MLASLVVLLLAFEAQCQCTLKSQSGTLKVTQSNQVIENVHVQAPNGDGISIGSGLSNITIQNSWIEFGLNGSGITFSSVNGLTIQNVLVELSLGGHSSGALPSSELVCINGYGTTNLKIINTTTNYGSSGIYLIKCTASYIGHHEAHNLRGPFPRGQCVQWDNSDNSVLEDFYCQNDNSSWTEDNISIYQSSNCTVRRGVVDGNNSPSGDGIMFEQSASGIKGGLCQNVDTVNQGNGCYAGYPAQNVEFQYVRTKNNHCTGWSGRAPPSSNALVFAGGSESGIDSHNLSVVSSQYYNLCNPGNLFWPTSAFSVMDAVNQDFDLREIITNKFCWQ